MKFGHVEIFVSKPMEAMDFYKKVLGFELVEIQDNRFIWMKSDGTHFLLRPGKPGEAVRDYASASAGFVLYTDDLDSTVKELSSRGLVFRGTDGSPKCLTFTDPDGNWFQLVNPNDH